MVQKKIEENQEIQDHKLQAVTTQNDSSQVNKIIESFQNKIYTDLDTLKEQIDKNAQKITYNRVAIDENTGNIMEVKPNVNAIKSKKTHSVSRSPTKLKASAFSKKQKTHGV